MLAISFRYAGPRPILLKQKIKVIAEDGSVVDLWVVRIEPGRDGHALITAVSE